MKDFRSKILRIYNSPTINTWLSFSAVPLNTLLFLPMMLRFFTTAEIAIWLLFNMYLSIQRFADFGFYNTFVRVISYGYGGSSRISFIDHGKQNDDPDRTEGPNWKTIGRVIGTMNRVYVYMTLALIVALALMSLSLKKPISDIENQQPIWISWGIIAFTSLINFYGRIYTNYLLGLNKVAIVRRLEGIFSILAILSNILVLYTTRSFLLVIISQQVWVLIRVIRNRYLAVWAEGGVYKELTRNPYEKAIFNQVWGPAWKSGISSLSSTGITYATGIVYSQLSSSMMLAKYLLALKFLEVIKNVSMAPLYSKIPLLSRLISQNKITDWKRISKRGILLSNYILLAGILFLYLFGNELIVLISDNIGFPNKDLWLLLGIGLFFQRYGALHTQLYQTTNKVNSHINDVISGTIYLGISILMLGSLDVYAFAYGWIAGYAGFYVWYALYYSYKIIREPFFSFEWKTTLLPIVAFILVLVLDMLWVNYSN